MFFQHHHHVDIDINQLIYIYDYNTTMLILTLTGRVRWHQIITGECNLKELHELKKITVSYQNIIPKHDWYVLLYNVHCYLKIVT